MQKYLHQMHPPPPHPRLSIAGLVDGELASVAIFRPVDLGGQPLYFIDALAVAVEYQRCGLGIATLNQVVDEVVRRAIESGRKAARLEAMVHEGNIRSQKMNERARFERAADLDEDDHQGWRITIEVPTFDDIE